MTDAVEAWEGRPAAVPETGAAPTAAGRLAELGVRDLALIAWGARKARSERAENETSAWIGFLETAHDWQPPPFPVKGKDAVKLGLMPGPEMGALLRDLQQWWEDEDFQPTRAALLERLREQTASDS